MRNSVCRMGCLAVALVVWSATWARGQDQPKNAPAEPPAQPKAADLPGPPPIPDDPLGPVLRTVPVRKGAKEFNWVTVETKPLPRDKEGIWVLDFSFRPMRIIQLDVPGKGRRNIHYLYYRATNHTGKARMFVPQFTLVTDTGKRYEDLPMPKAVTAIQYREDPSIPLLGAVAVVGMIPPNTKQGVDDAVYGVAVWEGIDPKADRISVYVRGLSDGHKVIEPPGGGKPQVQYKTLRVDLIRRGDQFNIHEKEIELLDPPYEWTYY